MVTDSTYFRTTSSMEASLVDTYRQLLALGTLPAELAQTMKTFMDQHNEHLAFFQKLTTEVGGKEVSDPNPVVQVAFVKPAMVLAAKDGNKPEDLVSIALGVETLAAETYQQFTPLLTVPKLRGSLMSVGGVEARHAAILTKAAPTGQPVPPVTTVPATTTSAGIDDHDRGGFPDAQQRGRSTRCPGRSSRSPRCRSRSASTRSTWTRSARTRTSTSTTSSARPGAAGRRVSV